MSKTNERCYLFSGILIGLFIVLTYLVITDTAFLAIVDQPISHFIRSTMTSEKTWIFKYFSYFANMITLVVLTLFSMSIFYFKKKDKVTTYWLAITIGIVQGVGNFVIKFIIQRPRPDVDHLVHSYNTSFPSAHAMGSVLFYGLMFVLSTRLIKSRSLRFLIQMFLVLIIVMVGFSRIYLGVHYPTDVLGGYLLGLIWLNISYPTFRKYELIQRRKGKKYYVSIQ